MEERERAVNSFRELVVLKTWRLGQAHTAQGQSDGLSSGQEREGKETDIETTEVSSTARLR